MISVFSFGHVLAETINLRGISTYNSNCIKIIYLC